MNASDTVQAAAGTAATKSPAQVEGPQDEATARPVLHQPFSWHHIHVDVQTLTRPAQAADFAGSVRDIAQGVSDVLSILEQDELDGACADEEGHPLPRLVSVQMAGNLQRLCITSLDLLAVAADLQIEQVRSGAERGVA